MPRMKSLHIDLWSAGEGGAFSTGPSGTPVTLDVSGGVWNSFEIDLTAYAGAVDLSNVLQMKFDPVEGGLKEFYIDNLMFTDNAPDYAIPAYPQDAAPEPALVTTRRRCPYTAAVQTSLAPTRSNWGRRSLDPANGLDAAVGDVLKMTNLNYQGIALGSSVDVSQLKTLHIDLWSASPGTVQLFLVPRRRDGGDARCVCGQQLEQRYRPR